MVSGPESVKARSDLYLGRIEVLEDVLRHLMSNLGALNEAQRVIDSAHSDQAKLKACADYVVEVHAGYNRIQRWALDAVDEAVSESDVMKAELKKLSDT